MKLTSVLLCAGFLQLSAHGFSQEKITVDYKNINIARLLTIIGKQSDYTFLYKNAIIPDKKISISMKDAPVREILDNALAGTSLDYKVMKDNLVVIVEAGDKVLNINIKGKVTDEAGNPLIGVTVLVKGTTHGAHTDENGRFSLDVPENAILEFSYVGYETMQMTAKADQHYNISMKANSSGLNEVVVVGYGKQKRINLSGAVDAISGKELESRPITNVGSGLQGLIPNLNITNTDGRASSAQKFNLRGMTSINGGDPFILVDNIPFTSDEVSRINPADIQSVTVLKDAAAAAIYGARAAFGVVLITTKSGKDGRIAVTANTNYAVRTLGMVPKITTDPLTTMLLKHDAAAPLYNLYPQSDRDYALKLQKDPSLPRAIVSPTDAKSWNYYGETDWLHEVYNKSAPAYTANFSISRGDEKLNYYLSGEYYSQDGMLRNNPDKYERYNLRAKATYTFNDRFKLGTNTMYTNTKYDQPFATSTSDASTYAGSTNNSFFNAVNRTPSLSIPRNPDGTWTSDGASLLGVLENGGRKMDTWSEFMTTLNAELGLIKDVWTLKADATWRRGNNVGKGFSIPVAYRTGPNQPLNYTGNNLSSASNSSNDVKYNVYNIYTDFHKTFNRKHAIGALVGFNQEYHYYNNFFLTANGLISPSLPTTQLTTGLIKQEQHIADWAVRGIYYRLNYTFDDKYIVELNARNDGSSRFRADNRWGFFPSASAAWVISKEKFFDGVKQAAGLDFMKLRGSYGTLGDQQWSEYGYMSLMKPGNITTIVDGKQPIAVYDPTPVTATYTWQTVKTINGGIDLSFLKERLSFSYDRYTRYTNGMFAPSQKLPNVYGAKSPSTNSADLKTRGWEMTLSWRDQFNIGKDPFNYSVKLLVADSRSFITRYANPTGSLIDYDHSDATKRNYYVGQEIGDIWGLVTEGFFQSQEEIDKHAKQTEVGSDDQNYLFYVGDLKFKDLNNDGKINYGDRTVSNPGDRRIIGNNAPRFPYSVDLAASFKGFDIRALIQGIGKRDWYPNASNHYFWGVYAQPWTNVQLHNLDRWTPDNPNGYFPRLKSYIAEDATELGAPQTRYLQNAAYTRLKNVTLGYTLPKQLTERIKLSRVRFYFSAENIFTISHLKANIDPEGLGGALYPYQKTYSCGLNLNF